MINKNKNIAIGIDLGGTNIKGVLVTADGDIIKQLSRATDDTREESRNTWKETVRDMLAELNQGTTPVPTGLSAPGIPDQNHKAIAHMPGRLHGLEGFTWEEHLDQPEVWVLNDAHSALMAEAAFGAGKGIKNLILLTLGTGVGGGILIDGKIYTGHYGMAGHLGHVTIDADSDYPDCTQLPGSLEDAISEKTLSRRTMGRYHTTKGLVEAHLAGDTLATYFWLHSVKRFAVGLCGLCNAISPEMILLGGGISKAKEALFEPLEEFMSLYEWRPGKKQTTIAPAQFSEYAGAIGAAAFALSKTIDK